MKKELLPACSAVIIVALFSTACKKSDQSLIPNNGNDAGDPAVFSVSIDSSVGSIRQHGLSDTFFIELKNPGYKAPAVPLVLHLPVGATSNAGTKVDDKTWNDTIDISSNKVQAVVITDKNGVASTFHFAYTWLFQNYTTANGLAGNTVLSLAWTGDSLYIGTTGGLSMWPHANGAFINSTTANGLATNSIYSITLINNVVYTGGPKSLGVSMNGGQSFFNVGFGGNIVWGFSLLDKISAVSTSGGVYYNASNGAGYIPLTTTNGLGSNMVYNCLLQPGDVMIAGTDGGLSYRSSPTSGFFNYTQSDGLAHNFVFNLFLYRDTIYAGTMAGYSVVAVKDLVNKNKKFSNYSSANGLSYDRVNGMYVDDEAIYVGTSYGLSVSADRGKHFSNYTTVNGLADNMLYCVNKHGGSIYVGTNSGLTIISPR